MSGQTFSLLGLRLKELGLLEAKTATQAHERKVKLSQLTPGIQAFDDVFIAADEKGEPQWVTSRQCDHAGGRLLLDRNGCTATCPLHGWKLDLATLAYKNVRVQKKKLPFRVEGDTLCIVSAEQTLHIPEEARISYSGDITVRFLAHACVLIDIAGFRIATDPWLLGPCFSTGWWHAVPPKADALQEVAAADLIYISHNHPDHLHPETLASLSKTPPVIVPNFTSGSALKALRASGDYAALALPFNTMFLVEGTPVSLALLKSGDFRDDSGLLICAGDTTVLLTVDSAALNSNVLPQKVDLLMSSFSSGASGYPWCFEHYTMDERKRITERFKGAARAHVLAYLDACKPKAYAPYAGFFTEAASVDAFIREHNTKNTAQDMQQFVQRARPDIQFINPLQTDVMQVRVGTPALTTCIDKPPLYEVNAQTMAPYFERLQVETQDFQVHELKDYFEKSTFRDTLHVYVLPTDMDFNPMEQGVCVDFSDSKPTVQVLNAQALKEQYAQADATLNRHLFIRIRKAPLAYTLRHKRPWEDLSIGFQCRIERKPDVYNSDFWFYFTNEYIG